MCVAVIVHIQRHWFARRFTQNRTQDRFLLRRADNDPIFHKEKQQSEGKDAREEEMWSSQKRAIIKPKSAP